MADIKAMLAQAKLAERSVEVCLRADLTAAMQDLQRRLLEVQHEQEIHGSLDGGGERELAEAIEATRQQMLEHSLTFRLRALPRRRYSALEAEHPPREDNDADRALGFNRDTFYEALLHASAVDPVMDASDWAALDEKISDGQWWTLVNAVMGVNARDVDVPFSRRASQVLRGNDDE